jgi:hypothetical protein
MAFAVALLFGLVTIPFTTLATSAVLARLPADHFVRPPRTWREAWKGSFWRKLGTAAKNFAGVALLGAGGIMLIPGMPGPGLLMVLGGLYLVDFPGKHLLQRRVLRIPWLRNRIDRVRARLGSPSLQFPPQDKVR